MKNFKAFTLQDCNANFIELIEKTRAHIVMLDFPIDGKKCMEILQVIKDRYPTLPVIAMSCNNNINTVACAKGFDGYIEKPFDIDLLYRILRKIHRKACRTVPNSSKAHHHENGAPG
ncbi:response regulator [Pedobacter frigiditerrae]|uniref:response regulator n=1 Tax=Pedobacter frigiditerrae TaxID=2530452 RepID=UPI0013F15D2A|nr:response regulator [Pedobacter frigiditerrae]